MFQLIDLPFKVCEHVSHDDLLKASEYHALTQSISFWMSVGGYLIRPKNIPIFWYCWAYWVDFQKYAYQLLINSDFSNLVFTVNFCVSSLICWRELIGRSV